jgi:hypothetical protein
MSVHERRRLSMDIENGAVIFRDYLKRIVTAARCETGNHFACWEMGWGRGGVHAWLAPLAGRDDIQFRDPRNHPQSLRDSN